MRKAGVCFRAGKWAISLPFREGDGGVSRKGAARRYLFPKAAALTFFGAHGQRRGYGQGRPGGPAAKHLKDWIEMAITSGVRAPRAQIMIGGQSFNVLSASVNQEATRRSSTMSASCALNSFPGGDAFFAGLSDNKGSVSIDGMPLVTGEWDTATISYDGTFVALSGRDSSISLHERKSSEKFNNQKRSDIVNTVAQRNGLQAQVAQESLLAGKLFQIDWAKLTDGVSDAAILHKLAELSGARWWVKNGTLYFKGKNDISSSYIVRYQAGEPSSGDFLSMQASINLQAAKSIKVNVNSWHQKNKVIVSSTNTVAGAIGGTLTYNYRTPGLQQDHADDLAMNKAAEHSRHEIELQLNLVGDTSIDIGMGLQLVGTAFVQTFEMDHITHQIGPAGYTMQITAKSARQGRGSSGSDTSGEGASSDINPATGAGCANSAAAADHTNSAAEAGRFVKSWKMMV
jgi:phage protein D